MAAHVKAGLIWPSSSLRTARCGQKAEHDPRIGVDLEQRVAGRAGAGLTASKVPVGATTMTGGMAPTGTSPALLQPAFEDRTLFYLTRTSGPGSISPVQRGVGPYDLTVVRGAVASARDGQEHLVGDRRQGQGRLGIAP